MDFLLFYSKVSELPNASMHTDIDTHTHTHTHIFRPIGHYEMQKAYIHVHRLVKGVYCTT